MSETRVELVKNELKEEIDVSIPISVKKMKGTKRQYKEELIELSESVCGVNDTSIEMLLKGIAEMI